MKSIRHSGEVFVYGDQEIVMTRLSRLVLALVVLPVVIELLVGLKL